MGRLSLRMIVLCTSCYEVLIEFKFFTFFFPPSLQPRGDDTYSAVPTAKRIIEAVHVGAYMVYFAKAGVQFNTQRHQLNEADPIFSHAPVRFRMAQDATCHSSIHRCNEAASNKLDVQLLEQVESETLRLRGDSAAYLLHNLYGPSQPRVAGRGGASRRGVARTLFLEQPEHDLSLLKLATGGGTRDEVVRFQVGWTNPTMIMQCNAGECNPPEMGYSTSTEWHDAVFYCFPFDKERKDFERPMVHGHPPPKVPRQLTWSYVTMWDDAIRVAASCSSTFRVEPPNITSVDVFDKRRTMAGRLPDTHTKEPQDRLDPRRQLASTFQPSALYPFSAFPYKHGYTAMSPYHGRIVGRKAEKRGEAP
ncbi:hypothetical protein ACRALDRAFT_2021202 [Sodiomyces alcalophilus JCM 7366]|uniref:uncharacterized protein n=1 Tax=Sodiomyces alcalophilus JCM 7366 TaxID=591952 RepID=UPI0039B46AD4